MRTIYCNCHGVPKDECPRVTAALVQGPLRSPLGVPAIRTSATFESGRGTLADQFKGDDKMLKYVVAQAKARGYNPSSRDVYMRSLAKFPGDPEAFVKTGEGESKVKDVIRKRNWTCEELGIEATDREPPKKRGLAPDLVEEVRRKMLKKDPSLKAKNQNELREAIIDKHGSKT